MLWWGEICCARGVDRVMIPKTGMTNEEFNSFLDKIDKKPYGSKDYRVIDNRIQGYVNDIDSLKQTVFFILSTERFRHITVSDNVGVELENLYGEDINLIEIKLKETIESALLADDRIVEIREFNLYRVERNTYRVELVIIDNLGSLIDIESEVVVGE